MKDYFLNLYRYNAWANKRALECLKKQNVEDQKILTIMSHILSALFIWLNRIKGLPTSPFPLWQQYKLEELITMGEDAGHNWLDFVEKNNDFNRELNYTNYQGHPFTNNVEKIMIHLVNHSTYHRGQIAMLLRQKGYEPVNTD